METRYGYESTLRDTMAKQMALAHVALTPPLPPQSSFMGELHNIVANALQDALANRLAPETGRLRALTPPYTLFPAQLYWASSTTL